MLLILMCKRKNQWLWQPVFYTSHLFCFSNQVGVVVIAEWRHRWGVLNAMLRSTVTFLIFCLTSCVVTVIVSHRRMFGATVVCTEEWYILWYDDRSITAHGASTNSCHTASLAINKTRGNGVTDGQFDWLHNILQLVDASARRSQFC